MRIDMSDFDVVYCDKCGKVIDNTQVQYLPEDEMILCDDCFDELVLDELSNTYNFNIEI